eukprot:991663-Alexandrium_andersonii.AAC.1
MVPVVVALPLLPRFLGELEVRRFQYPAHGVGVGDWKAMLTNYVVHTTWRLSLVPFPWVLMLIHFEQ